MSHLPIRPFMAPPFFQDESQPSGVCSLPFQPLPNPSLRVPEAHRPHAYRGRSCLFAGLCAQDSFSGITFLHSTVAACLCVRLSRRQTAGPPSISTLAAGTSWAGAFPEHHLTPQLVREHQDLYCDCCSLCVMDPPGATLSTRIHQCIQGK